MAKELSLSPGAVTLGQLRRIARSDVAIAVDRACRGGVEAAAATVTKLLEAGETVYGINTGFGALARTTIAPDQLAELQTNLVRSHCAGTGPLLDDATVRLVMALKLVGLARGHSGVRWHLIEAIEKMLAAGVTPCIPSKGSVGASGDLAPLAHMSAALMGEGEVRLDGYAMPAADGLARAGLDAILLAPKEGLALLNGTQVSTALALMGLFAAENLFASAVVAGAMSVDAAKGSDTPFDARVHDLRGQPGQTDVAAAYRALLDGSAIRASHLDCDRVQDPYSLRCQPQIMGACLDQIRHAAGVLVREANAVTDNPLIFADTGEVLSGGNFHGEPVAMAADGLALALAEMGALSERRVALLIDSSLSELPPFLTQEGGVNSGFMIAQVTAAALASENKSLAHPASVDSLPTSANQEDHVSMSTFAARRLGDMAENTAAIIGIELLAASQGLEFRKPLETSAPLGDVLARVRAFAPPFTSDRAFAPDIEAAKAFAMSDANHAHMPGLVPSLAGQSLIRPD